MMNHYFEKSVLAGRYFPELARHQATNRLRLWMKRCPPLMQELRNTGYHSHQRHFTPSQVKIIYAHLGEP